MLYAHAFNLHQDFRCVSFHGRHVSSEGGQAGKKWHSPPRLDHCQAVAGALALEAVP